MGLSHIALCNKTLQSRHVLQTVTNSCLGRPYTRRMYSLTEPIHVLLVDDDAQIRALVANYLEEHGLSVHTAANGEQMRRSLAVETVQVVLLDVMLPGEDGLTLCRELRGNSSVAIIMLTALAEESDRVLGLELGADDYLTKPFSSRELLARIRAVLRRGSDRLPVHQSDSSQAYGFNGWHLNPKTRELTDATQTVISLTAGEFDLLLAFVRNAGEVLDRDQLLALTKGRKAQAFDRSIDVQLSRLRKKLGAISWIKTVRGGGYLFAPSVQSLELN